jgi:pilus assembly protein Flp/PilA
MYRAVLKNDAPCQPSAAAKDFASLHALAPAPLPFGNIDGSTIFAHPVTKVIGETPPARAVGGVRGAVRGRTPRPHVVPPQGIALWTPLTVGLGGTPVAKCPHVTRPARRGSQLTAARAALRASRRRRTNGGSMNRLFSFVKSFVSRDEGQDLLEYALLVALIALVAIIAVTAAGGSVRTIFQAIADQLAAAA